MPFTPFHMGPGLLLKGGMQGAMSLLIFGWTQVLIDLQPLVALLTGWGELHGWSHTLLGATLIGVAAAVTGYYAMLVAAWLVEIDAALRARWWVAIASGLIGAYSHVAIDAVMHADVAPFAPFTTANPLVGLVGIAWLRSLCIYSGALGGLLYAAVLAWRGVMR